MRKTYPYILVPAEKGQTLVEIVISLGIVLLLVAGLIVATTSAIHISDQGRLRSLAIQYAQEGLELSRQLRDSNWGTFQAKSGLWCLDKADAWTPAGVSCLVNIDNTFTRGVTFTWNGAASRMEVTSTVSWQDESTTHQSQLTTYFTQWQ